MQLTQFTRMLAISLLLLLNASAYAQTSILDQLPSDTQEAISRVCLPVQYREGAAAYRNCVQAELALYRNGSATELGSLSFDDKYAVQQACAKAGAQSSESYQQCISAQIGELKTISEPALDKLSEDELYVVQQSCFNAQSKEGAASYRTCLNGEITSLLRIPAADTTQLGMLKKNALQLRCSSQSSNAVQYRQCVAAEYESIAGTAPSFLPVSTAATVSRPSYRNSATTPIAQSVAKVANETSNTSAQNASNASQANKPTMALPRNITPPQQAGAAAQLVEQAQDVVNPVVVEEAVKNIESLAAVEQTAAQADQPKRNTLRDATGAATAETTTNPNNTTTADARVISKPNLVDTIELQERAKQQGVELQTAIETEADPKAASDSGNFQTSDILPKLAAMGQGLLDKLGSLDRIGWLLVAGVLALPALLLGVFSLSRRFKQSAPVEHTASPLTERIQPGLQTRRLRQEREAAELFGDDDVFDNANGFDDGDVYDKGTLSGMSAHDRHDMPLGRTNIAEHDHDFPGHAEPADPYDHDAVTRLASKAERLPQPRNTAAQPESQHPHEPANDAVLDSHDPERLHWQSAFGNWLMQQPEQDRMEACIEFLIYWVAYGDDRYQPELRKRLFTATELSPHDQIKRWVLKQDVFAFSDVVGWMRKHASQTQLDQSLGLIMALLVTENNVTPVQNTLLRFLSDAFNIGMERLEQRFEKAFGHTLPPVPRPDNRAWWAKQQESALASWDARTLSGKPEKEQMIARLGLFENYEESQIIQAFRRAARRCHPDRFTELGDRERALAEQQFIKFEQARDKLLGVSV